MKIRLSDLETESERPGLDLCRDGVVNILDKGRWSFQAGGKEDAGDRARRRGVICL